VGVAETLRFIRRGSGNPLPDGRGPTRGSGRGEGPPSRYPAARLRRASSCTAFPSPLPLPYEVVDVVKDNTGFRWLRSQEGCCYVNKQPLHYGPKGTLPNRGVEKGPSPYVWFVFKFLCDVLVVDNGER